MRRFPRPLRIAGGVACGLGVAAAAVAITASAAGLQVHPGGQASLAITAAQPALPAAQPTPFSIVPKVQPSPPPKRMVATAKAN